jgi:iron complex transport system ATP-binding protein
LDYLTFSTVNQLEGFKAPSKTHLEKTITLAKSFGIKKFLYKRLNNLSGGEGQIVSICSAFIQEAPIIILDEPTFALDLKNQLLSYNS